MCKNFEPFSIPVAAPIRRSKMHVFPEFNLALRMLPTLAHVPPAHVKASFELVIEEITDVIEREQFEESVVEKMDELAIFFRGTYIENPIVNKKPPFPIEMWSQYDAAGEGVARTTNSVELRRIFVCSYGTWKKILFLSSE